MTGKGFKSKVGPTPKSMEFEMPAGIKALPEQDTANVALTMVARGLPEGRCAGTVWRGGQ